MNSSKIVFRVHAVQRMFERRISLRSVTNAVKSGMTIEDYSAEMPEPGRLILGSQGQRVFHVVISENLEANQITVITAYVPDSHKWTHDFRIRRS